MVMISCEDYTFAYGLAGGFAHSVFHEVPQNCAVGVFIIDDGIDLIWGEVILGRIFTLFFELSDLIGCQCVERYTLPNELGCMFEDFKRR